jgi:hypothetical protein
MSKELAMSETVETIERDGWTASVQYDDSPESPAAWSNVGTLAYRHRGASEGNLPHADYRLEDEQPTDAVVIVPVRSWDDRMGTELREADGWDEATGWIYATAESIEECIGKDATDEEVRAALVSELEAWQQWAQGDVYGVVVRDPDGGVVDSCWGMYGDEYAMEEAERMLTDAIDTEREEAERVARIMAL